MKDFSLFFMSAGRRYKGATLPDCRDIGAILISMNTLHKNYIDGIYLMGKIINI